MKARAELPGKPEDISRQLSALSGGPREYDLDMDAIVEPNMARDSLDRLIRPIEPILE